MRSVTCRTRSLPSGNPAEHRADSHAEPGQVTLPDNIAGHDFACGEDVGSGAKPLHFGLLVHLHSEIRERDSRPQRITVERRPVDSEGPMRFRRSESFSVAIIENLMIKRTRPHGSVEHPNRVL